LFPSSTKSLYKDLVELGNNLGVEMPEIL